MQDARAVLKNAKNVAIVDIVVILLTMNQREKTLRCLESFQKVNSPSFGIILWDNGSQDGTTEAVQENYPDVQVHYHPENAGVAEGRNLAAAMAIELFQPQYLMFLDNDMTVEPDFLQHLSAPFQQNERLAQTAGKIRDLNNPKKLYGAGGCRLRFWRGDTMHIGYGEVDNGQHDDIRDCHPSGGCMLVRRDVFQQLGGFDTIFSPYGPEDLDFGLRARKAGFQALYVPAAIVYHETRPGRTFEGGAYSEKFARNRVRHWLILLKRHAPLGEKLIFLGIVAPYLFLKVILRELRQGNVKALFGIFKGLRDFRGARREMQ